MSQRYDSNELDSPEVQAGDVGFFALDSRTEPENLPPGVLQLSENMRLNRRIATTRLGLDKVTNDIDPTGTVPLIVPFTVGAGAVVRNTWSDGLFASGIFSDPNDDNKSWIVLAGGSEAFLWNEDDGVETLTYPANEVIVSTDSVDIFQAEGSLYILRGEKDVDVAITSITRSASTATVTTTAAHGYSSNQYVRVSGADQPEYNVAAQITVTGASTFTYTVSGTPATPATGTIIVNRLKQPMRWDGDFASNFALVSFGTISTPFIYMPPSDYGLLMQNRAILQYARNQLIISDILDVESCDSIFGVFEFTSGQADYMMGFHPYQENKALVFNRRSLYLINDVDTGVNMMSTQEVTRQVGCVSRRSIVTCGADVLFLSDLGVFRLQPGFELQLRGNSEPLSAPIDDVIQTINTSAIQLAAGAYWNNRYYLAIPVSGSTRNNRIIVFNFLNNAWESVDTLPNGMYADFIEVKQFNNKDALFVVSVEGGIYAYEQLEFDEYAAAAEPPARFVIPGRLKTRRLIFDSYNLKHFNRVTVDLSFTATSSCTVKVNTVNPDATKTLKNISTTGAEELTYPLLVNKRGYGLDVEIVNTEGRTSLTNYSATAYEQNRKNIKIT